MTIEQGIQDIKNSHNKLWYIVIVLAILIGILLFRLFYGGTDPVIVRDDIKVRNSLDSLRIWTQQQYDVQQYNELRYHQDSIRIAGMASAVARVPGILQTINNKRDAQLHTIDNMSADQQFMLFSEWLSQADSL